TSLSQRSQLAQDGSGMIVLPQSDEGHRQLKLVVRLVIPQVEQALVASPGVGEILVVKRARRLLLIAPDQTGIRSPSCDGGQHGRDQNQQKSRQAAEQQRDVPRTPPVVEPLPEEVESPPEPL